MTEQTESPQPDDQRTGDDGGAALERAAASIREAEDAESTVAANDDITVLDDERAGEFSEDPDGAGGQP